MRKTELCIQHHGVMSNYDICDYTITSNTVYAVCGLDANALIADIIAPNWSKLYPIENIRIVKYEVDDVGISKVIDHAIFYNCVVINVNYEKNTGRVQYMFSYEYVQHGHLEDVDLINA